MIFAVSPVSAQWPDFLETKYPVCMEVYGSSGARIECAYWSMEQCWASTDGIAALCIANRYYAPLAPKAQWSPGRGDSHDHHHTSRPRRARTDQRRAPRAEFGPSRSLSAVQADIDAHINARGAYAKAVAWEMAAQE
jgi:hypothetical protein